MAQPVYRGTTNLIPELHDPFIQLRRTLIQDIKRFGDLLAASPLKDELTEILRIWQQNCSSGLELRNVDFQNVIQPFLDFLETILIVPVLKYPLDDECMLGNDGHTYGNNFLRLHSYRSAPPFDQRSPLKPDDPTPFTAVPHDIARTLIQWLKKYRPNFRSDTLDREVSQIPENGRQAFADPPPAQNKPNNLKERVKKILQEQAELKQEAAQREQIRLQERTLVEGKMDAIIVNNLVPFQQGVADKHADAHKRLDNIEHPLQVLAQQTEQLDQEIHTLNYDIIDLKDQLKRTDAQVDGAKADNIQLQIAIKETEQAVKNRDKGGFGEIISAIAAIAACAAASWAIQALLKSLGATTVSASVSPIRGGVKAEVIFKGFK